MPNPNCPFNDLPESASSEGARLPPNSFRKRISVVERGSAGALPARMQIVTLLALFALCGCQVQSAPSAGDRAAGSPADAGTRVKVVTTHPVRKSLTRVTEQPGRIEPFEEAPLFAKVSGYVIKMHVDIGDSVTGPKYASDGMLAQPGQVLMELEVPELQQDVEQKKALIDKADAELKQAVAAIKVAEARRDSAAALRTEAQAATERDQANYERWRSEFQRISELAAKGTVTRKVAEETENQLKAADAARRETAAHIQSATAKLQESEVAIEKAEADRVAAAAHTKVAKADAQRVQTLLDYATIRAPFDGVITERNVHPGHLIPIGTSPNAKPALTVVRMDPVRVFVDVPEKDAVYTERGNSAEIRVTSLSGALFTGTVTRTAWVLDTNTRTLRTEIDLENREHRLRPGMFATAILKVAEREDALSLPKTAVFQQGNKSVCFRVGPDNKIVAVPIQTGIQTETDVEVLSGLKGDEEIIASNVGSYREGQDAEIAREPAAKPK